jgi:hypothetical protein
MERSTTHLADLILRVWKAIERFWDESDLVNKIHACKAAQQAQDDLDSYIGARNDSRN